MNDATPTPEDANLENQEAKAPEAADAPQSTEANEEAPAAEEAPAEEKKDDAPEA